MKVKLIGYTQSPADSTDEGIGNVEDMIAFCARVSNPTNQMNTETTTKLLKYLATHKHWSPFEMASATMEIETTRDIARQMLRHRSFAFQEFSQRYADPSAMGYPFALREARLQDTKNRQNSVEVDDVLLEQRWIQQQKTVIDAASTAYRWAIDNGIAKEQARCVMPEGNTISRLFANATLRSWIHYIELRSGHGTQLEHMDLARAIAVEIAKIFPMTTEFVSEV